MTSHSSPVTRHRTLAVIGSNGMLAQAVTQLVPDDYTFVPLDLPEFDLTDSALVDKTLGSVRPDVIVNCAAFTDVDGCEAEENPATRVNGTGPGNLARSAKALGAVLIHISTDYVFDGSKQTPYMEDDVPCPQSAYGRSKLAGEKAILESGLEKFFIVRTSWLYGPGGKNFVETILRLAKEREELRIVADQIGTPTYTHDLAHALFSLSRVTNQSSPVSAHSPYGIYHFSNEGLCSWHEFAEEIVKVGRELQMPLKAKRILPIPTSDFPLPAQRPAYSVFDKRKYLEVTGASIPEWQDSLRKYFTMRQQP